VDTRPGVRAVGLGFLEFDKLGQIGFVERVGLAQVAVEVELVVPDFSVRAPFSKKSTTVFTPAPVKGASGAVEHRVQVAAFQ
jgi:hypothetical protein